MQLTLATLAAIAIGLGVPVQGAALPAGPMQHASHTHAPAHTPTNSHSVHAPSQTPPSHANKHMPNAVVEERDLPPAIAGILGLIGGVLGGLTNVTDGILNITDGLLANLLLVQQASSGPQPVSYIMAASMNSSTPVYMVQNPSAMVETAENELPVTIHVPMYDAVNAAMVDRCLTYDPMPSLSSDLAAAPCSSSSTDEHASQDFIYNTVTSVVSPVFADASPDAALNSTASPATSAAYMIDAALPDGTNSTSPLSNATDSILIVFTPTTSFALAAPDIVANTTGMDTGASGDNSTDASGNQNEDGTDEDGTEADFSNVTVDEEQC